MVCLNGRIANIGVGLVADHVDGNRNTYTDLALRGRTIGNDFIIGAGQGLHGDGAVLILTCRNDSDAVIDHGIALSGLDIQREGCRSLDAAAGGGGIPPFRGSAAYTVAGYVVRAGATSKTSCTAKRTLRLLVRRPVT